MKQAPCKDCKDRKIGCHGSCNLYRDWLLENREATEYIKEKINTAHKYEDDIKRWCR